MKTYAFKLEPGVHLAVIDPVSAPPLIQLSGVVSAEFVRGLNHPLTDPSFYGLSSDQFEYEITVKATRKFTPGHYRKKRADGNSDVCYYRTPPWTLGGYAGTEFAKRENWERVKVVAE